MPTDLVTPKAQLSVRDQWMLDRREKRGANAPPAAAKGPPKPAASSAPELVSSTERGASSSAAALPGGAVVGTVALARRNKEASALTLSAAPNAARRDEMAILDRGHAAPLLVELPRLREADMLEAIAETNTAAKKEEKLTVASIRIQSMIRMFLERRRLREHRTTVAAEIRAIVNQRNIRCAVTLQRVVRGLVARTRYRRQREEEALAALEAAKSKAGRGKGRSGGKSGGGGGGPSNLSTLLSPAELAFQQNSNFVNGVRKWFAGALDEALSAFEAQQKAKPEPVTAAMVDIVRRRRDGGGPGGDGKGGGGAGDASPKKKPTPKAAGKKKK